MRTPRPGGGGICDITGGGETVDGVASGPAFVWGGFIRTYNAIPFAQLSNGDDSKQPSGDNGDQQASEPVGCVTVVDSASGTTSRSCDSGGPISTGANKGSVAQEFLEGVVDGAFNIASDYFYVISFGQLAPEHPVDLGAGTPVYQVGGTVGEEIGVAAGWEVSELSGAADALTEAAPVAAGAAADCVRNFGAAYSPTPSKPSTILGMACYGAGVLLNQLAIP